MIPPPHGGRLVERRLSDSDRSRRESELASLPTIAIALDQLYDLEKIGIGAYSPLEGFMDAATLTTVVETGRLPDGLPWSLPILLPLRRPEGPGDRGGTSTGPRRSPSSITTAPCGESCISRRGCPLTR